MKRKKNVVELVAPQEYLHQATQHAKTAKRRIFLISLTIFHNEATSDLLEAIATAARRGVKVHIAADFVTFTQAMSTAKKIPLTYRSSSVRANSELKKKFSAAGAKFRWIGQYYGATFMGRTHSKWLVVDDTVFSFGGVNIDSQQNLCNTDYMLKIESRELADLLAREQIAIEKADRARRAPRNHSVETALGTVLFDSGKMGRSIIYQTVCRLARQASEVLLVSQYCPTGRLARTLSVKPSQIYFNQLENVDSRLNRFIIRLGKQTAYGRNLYMYKKYLHAKFIIFTMPDGSRQAITGSHNFVAASSRLGTREVALLTKDEQIICQLEDFFRKNVA